MYSFLPKYTFRTLERLSQGLKLLIQSEVSQQDLAEAKQLLQEYGKRYNCIYGDTNMVMNIHLLSHHLADCVAAGGPLWTFWCYPFESFLGYIKKFTHGTRRPENSFIFGTQLIQVLPVLDEIEAKKMSQISGKQHFYTKVRYLFC